MINVLTLITAHTLFYSPIFLRNTTLRFDFLSKHFWISNGLSRDGPAQNAIHALSLIQRRIRRRRQNPTCKSHHYYYIHSKLSYVISLWLDFLTKIPFTHPFKHSTFRIRTQSGLSLPGMFAIIWMDPWYTRHKMPCIALTPSNTKMGA